MTRIFKMVLVGAMLVGLLVAPLGLAQADQIGGNANGAGFEWTIPTVTVPTVVLPTVQAPTLEIELNGEKHTIGGTVGPTGGPIGGEQVGGVLKVAFRASEWLVSYATAECPAGQLGKAVAMLGKTPGATLQATYTPLGGTAQNFAPAPVDGRNPTAAFSLCV